MAVYQRRYPKEALARLGKELYESQIRQQVEPNNFGKIVAIDIETGAFEVADDTSINFQDNRYKRSMISAALQPLTLART